uniref:Uncharacterized protein n=1 Tax=Odontella aurita TaxID=265563 RepID=A0A7S4IPM5_9STRA|mmetsp:Transcript_28376/g.83481  ORF Transcript_28376/g.83481 Transcript_28376/m.83481 type:complete len:236 (+) Transcript_28376:152-859(+)|eukprot:CAMPEP_0113554780 /NCGR_PEP_ID=MMETSP0015_2-20120614/16345_1 /TAXON_ID=2838 /ORGANISM="Odontella" /LENGTH=235 /DNA_ID=CAMNT_0000455971 /DNA_START=139 /DNA_END=846 /DNA_ORIENTATION=+ /assembly_acc=CAM_ASM_000160
MASTETLVKSVDLLDEDEQPVSSREIIGEVSADRLEVWSSRIADVKEEDQIIAVRCSGGRGPLEHAVRVRGGVAAPLMLECKVSYEEMPPSSLVEYKFSDGDGQWRLSMVCLEYLLAFRAGKFKDWEKRMLQPTCKAEFRRMFGIGPVYTVYDHHMFPSSEEEKARFEVTDDNGKKVILPRPVSALRIWSTEKQCFEDVDPTLDGAPQNRDSYWEELVARLEKNFPEEVKEMTSK